MDIAKLLNVPESTVRTWRDNFQAYIPADGEGRTRRYTEASIQVFQLIYQYKQQGKKEEEIKKLLESAQTEKKTLALMDSPKEITIHDVKEIVAAFIGEINALRVEVADLKAETKKQQVTEQNHFEQMQQILTERDEKVLHFIDEWRQSKSERKPLWTRIFRK